VDDMDLSIDRVGIAGLRLPDPVSR